MIKQKLLNLAMQGQRMKHDYRNWNYQIIRDTLVCEGILHPTLFSEEYLVKIYYSLKDRPKIYLMNPKLRKNERGDRSPHLYSDDRLCVYHPSFGEWDGSKYISQTIVPWISLWLYYYEIWHATGEWLGGGVHVSKK